MSYTPAQIAEAVWTHATRTVDAASPVAPDGTAQDAIAYAVWTYASRTITGGGTCTGSQPRQTGTATGSVNIIGAVSGSQVVQGGQATGSVNIAGIVIGSQLRQTGLAEGHVAAPAVTGEVAGQQPRQFGLAGGSVNIIGDVNGSQVRQSGTASGQQAYSAIVSGSQPVQAGLASGVVTPAPDQFVSLTATTTSLFEIVFDHVLDAPPMSVIDALPLWDDYLDETWDDFTITWDTYGQRRLLSVTYTHQVTSAVEIHLDDIFNATDLNVDWRPLWDDYVDEAWDDFDLEWNSYGERRLLAASFTAAVQTEILLVR